MTLNTRASTRLRLVAQQSQRGVQLSFGPLELAQVGAGHAQGFSRQPEHRAGGPELERLLSGSSSAGIVAARETRARQALQDLGCDRARHGILCSSCNLAE